MLHILLVFVVSLSALGGSSVPLSGAISTETVVPSSPDRVLSSRAGSRSAVDQANTVWDGEGYGPLVFAPERPATSDCFVEVNGDNVTDFASSDAQALRDALAAVASGSIIKVAGTCTGAVSEGGEIQVAWVTKTITLIGGYTTTNWASSFAITQPTTLDALAAGRVLRFNSTASSVIDIIVQNGFEASGHGGGIISSGALTLSGVYVLSSTARLYGGGLHILGSVTLSATTFANNASQLGYGGGLYANDALQMDGGRFISNSAITGGGVYVYGAATITHVLFQENVANYGGGLVGNTAIVLSSTEFTSNTAQSSGGGINSAGSLTLSECVFQGNAAISGNGGGLFSVSALDATNTRFLSNTAQLSGGGAFAIGAVVLSGGMFSSNAAQSDGGGLLTQSTSVLVDAKFISNTAGGRGGGAFLSGVSSGVGGLYQNNTALNFGGGMYAGTSVTLVDHRFLTNTASGGGGLYVINGDATVLAGLFQANEAKTSSGGGIYARSRLTMSDTDFIENIALEGLGGGAVAVGIVTLNGGLFHENQALQGGGLDANVTLTLTSTQFVRNSAIEYGGGVIVFRSASLAGGLFLGNRAITQDGGGLYASRAVALTGTQFVDNWAASGGAIYHNSGAARLTNALFARNTASTTLGSAMYLHSAESVDVLFTTIVSPTLVSDAAIFVFSGTVHITNTIIASHTIGLSQTGGIVFEDYNLFDNVAVPRSGSIPVGMHSFTGTTHFMNPAADDYRLSPGSPAIDAGVNAGVTTDFEGTARPFGSSFDIGYDEWSGLPRAFLPSIMR